MHNQKVQNKTLGNCDFYEEYGVMAECFARAACNPIEMHVFLRKSAKITLVGEGPIYQLNKELSANGNPVEVHRTYAYRLEQFLLKTGMSLRLVQSYFPRQIESNRAAAFLRSGFVSEQLLSILFVPRRRVRRCGLRALRLPSRR